MAEYYGNINDYMRNNGLSGELNKDQFASFQAQRPLNSSNQVLTNTQTTQFQQPTSYAQVASPSMSYYGTLKDGTSGWDSNIDNFQAGGISEALGTGDGNLYDYYGNGLTGNLSSTIGQGQAGLNSLQLSGDSSAAGGQNWLDVQNAGGSKFSNTMQGLGSLYGIYATHQGIGAAKDALNFEKQKYADLKALQAKSDANKEKFGLALQSASKANGLIK